MQYKPQRIITEVNLIREFSEKNFFFYTKTIVTYKLTNFFRLLIFIYNKDSYAHFLYYLILYLLYNIKFNIYHSIYSILYCFNKGIFINITRKNYKRFKYFYRVTLFFIFAEILFLQKNLNGCIKSKKLFST